MKSPRLQGPFTLVSHPYPIPSQSLPSSPETPLHPRVAPRDIKLSIEMQAWESKIRNSNLIV